MMDGFDEKRQMVKMLLDMLKGSAADEVSNGLKKPEGEGDMHGLQVEKVEVLPDHRMDEPTPEHDVEMHSDGIADEVLPKGSIAEEMKRAPEMAAEDDAESHAEDDNDDMEDSPSHAFASLMKKKK